MKKCLSIFILVFLSAFILCGCRQDGSNKVPKGTVFYYPALLGSNSFTDGIMSKEIREAAQYGDDYVTLVNDYIKGPVQSNLYSLFPEGSHAVSINKTDTRVIVFMNESYAKLSGIQLSLASSGLALTLMDYTDTAEVGICVKGCMLNGQRILMFNKENMIFTEEIIPSIP